jgi:hypothetical protein
MGNKMAKISQDSFPKRREVGRGGGGGGSTLVGNSAAAEGTFKIQIEISKMRSFAFKCKIFLLKID